jgi:hypothetical protein
MLNTAMERIFIVFISFPPDIMKLPFIPIVNDLKEPLQTLFLSFWERILGLNYFLSLLFLKPSSLNLFNVPPPERLTKKSFFPKNTSIPSHPFLAPQFDYNHIKYYAFLNINLNMHKFFQKHAPHLDRGAGIQEI